MNFISVIYHKFKVVVVKFENSFASSVSLLKIQSNLVLTKIMFSALFKGKGSEIVKPQPNESVSKTKLFQANRTINKKVIED